MRPKTQKCAVPESCLSNKSGLPFSLDLIETQCTRHGVALRPRAPVTERRWFRDGALHKDGPASPAELEQHERCVSRIAADALSLKKGEEHNEFGQSLTDISFAAYLTRIGAPQATRDLCGAWWTVSGNGDPAGFPRRNSCRAAPVAAARPTV